MKILMSSSKINFVLVQLTYYRHTCESQFEWLWWGDSKPKLYDAWSERERERERERESEREREVRLFNSVLSIAISLYTDASRISGACDAVYPSYSLKAACNVGTCES